MENHNFTIRYFNPNRTETASVSNTQITNTNMSNFTGLDCGSLSVGDIISLTDERNGQTYQVKKMQDNKCWMVDNLKYAGEANTDLANVDGTYGLVYNNESGKYNTVDGTSTQSTENSDKAFYNNPMSDSYCYGTSIQSSYTKCGYLYNWYAATAGTGTYATSTQGTNVSGSICPTGWRLPSAMSDGSTATGNGTSYTAADFAVLNASMNAGSLTTGSTSGSYYAGWQFTGAWSGVFSGSWSDGFNYQDSYGYYWSSTASSSTAARYLYFYSSHVSPGGSSVKYGGRAVRCVMDGASGTRINYDANGGYFDDNLSKTVNPVYYNIDELSTQTIDEPNLQDGYYYDKTITIPNATSLTADYSCQIGSKGDYITLYSGIEVSEKAKVAECTGIVYPSLPGEEGLGFDWFGPSGSGTYAISGDSITIHASIDKMQATREASLSATIKGYDIATIHDTEELVPTRPGYTFLGWYTDAAGSYDNKFTVNGDMASGTTIYAKWLKDITIIFDGNGSTSGSMANQIIKYGENVLSANKYSKAGGYDFVNWNTEADGSGTTYVDSETFTYTSPLGSDTIILYAQWGQNFLDDVTYMQDLTATQCSDSYDGATAALKDRRDNNTYTVAKINGNCWMTQNLRLSSGRTLTPADSNVDSNWSFPSTSLTSGDSFTAARSLISDDTSYGGYYNYCAASAGTVCDDTTIEDATQDICPASWRLPTEAEFDAIPSWYPAIFSPVRSGYYDDGSLRDDGSRGYWWSATANGDRYQYYLSYSGYLSTLILGYKDEGYSIRCILSN